MKKDIDSENDHLLLKLCEDSEDEEHEERKNVKKINFGSSDG